MWNHCGCALSSVEQQWYVKIWDPIQPHHYHSTSSKALIPVSVPHSEFSHHRFVVLRTPTTQLTALTSQQPPVCLISFKLSASPPACGTASDSAHKAQSHTSHLQSARHNLSTTQRVHSVELIVCGRSTVRRSDPVVRWPAPQRHRQPSAHDSLWYERKRRETVRINRGAPKRSYAAPLIPKTSRTRTVSFGRRAERGEAKFGQILSIMLSIVTVRSSNIQYK